MIPRRLNDDERVDWVRLARTPRIGPVTFAQLMSRYRSAAAALEALPGLMRNAGGTIARDIPSTDIIEAEIEAASRIGARLVASIEPEFPSLLCALDPPPPVLTMMGRRDLANRPALALVGARDASAAGRKIARDMASALGKAGYITVSGLALGIDGEVHAASLATGTIAVLGGGIDHVYPPQHERLYASVALEGLIVSESPFGYKAKARDFPRRNRIITGMAEGVIVVEAAARSGSLISARTAGEQGREVMAVPGSPLDPRAEGTNGLIRSGALLVRNADDVLEAMAGGSVGRVSAPASGEFESESRDGGIPDDQFHRVRAVLTPFPLAMDEIARAAGLSRVRTGAILMELELAGDAVTYPGGLASLSV